MYAASPSLLWIWPPKPSSPLTISTFSSSFAAARRRRSGSSGKSRPRFCMEPSSSSSSSYSSSSFSVESKGDLELSAEKKGMISDKGVGIEGSGALDQRVVLGLGSKRFGRRPLWKRIFFASKKVRSIILLNVLTVIYASDIPVLKEVEAVTEPALFNVVRFIVSAIPFPPFVLKGCGDRHTRTAGVELGLWVSFGYVSQALGLLTSEAGRASFISTFTVIVVPLMDGMLGAAVPALTWCGAIVSLLGVAMLECVGSPPCVGDVLNILSAVFFGIHMLRTEQISRSTKKDNFLALLGFEVCVVALSSVVWFLIKDIFNDVHQLSFASCSLSKLWDFMTSFPWIPALYTGVFSTGLCLWAEMYAMGDVSATETAIIYGMEPLWGASFAWFLLDERWDTTTWIGAALVLCGSLTVQILGSAQVKSNKEEDSRSNTLKSSQKQNYFSFSAVVVDSRKDVARQFKRTNCHEN
ncbi:uncharacterized protein LOC109712958 isoform X2 [Ananas comosus]|uniref:Uncharacterized protein LOC109712958 isoform X2 n=1 Tax=Ananas comosus TaxID=4615 RepID=A0A6P5F8Y0_ANACO|nr:uncharacterized protein LOC109712958 isoform X2 [Ananas comosus]